MNRRLLAVLSFAALLSFISIVTTSRAAELEPIKVQLQVRDGGGAPVAAARVGFFTNSGARPVAQGQTDSAGQAVLQVPADVIPLSIYAWKPGVGLDYRGYYDRSQALQQQPPERPDLSEPIQLTLGQSRTIRVRVIDDRDETPIADATVHPWYVQKPGEPNDLNFLSDEFATTTNAEGVASFDWLPTWDENPILTFWPRSKEHTSPRGEYEYATGDGTLTLRLAKLVPVSGHIRLPDGSPAPGIQVRARGDGYSFDSFQRDVLSDQKGRFEFGAAPNMVYLLVVDDRKWAAAPQTGLAVRPNSPIAALDFQLRPATRLFGRVTVGPENQPVVGQRIDLYQYDSELRDLEALGFPNPGDSNDRWVQPMFVRYAKTDNDGRFELAVGPGQYDIRGPQQNEIEKFEIVDELEREFNFHSARPEEGPLAGLVVSGDPPQPVPNAKITGIYRHGLANRDLEAVTDADGRFNVQRYLHRTVLHARSADGSLAGIVQIEPDGASVTIPIQALATATARLLDGETNDPLPDKEIRYGVKVHIGDDDAPWRTEFGGATRTDAEGRFMLSNLVVGASYDVDVTIEVGRRWQGIGTVQPASSETIDLADLRLEPEWRPPTLAQRVAKAFDHKQPLRERYENGLNDTRLARLRLLLLFADPKAPATEQYYQHRYEHDDVRPALDDYWVIPIDVTGDHASEARELAGQLGISLEGSTLPVLVALTSDAEHLASIDASQLSTDGQLDGEKLIAFLKQHALPPLDAQVVLTAALEWAAAENKRVITQETATWCGPCWRLSRFVDKHRPLFEKDYIHIKIDRRWTHSEEVADKLREGEHHGIPFFVILDAEGNTLTTSEGADGNIGFPTDPAAIEHFLEMLKSTRQRLTDEELAEIKAGLEASQ